MTSKIQNLYTWLYNGEVPSIGPVCLTRRVMSDTQGIQDPTEQHTAATRTSTDHLQQSDHLESSFFH